VSYPYWLIALVVAALLALLIRQAALSRSANQAE
jgi:hypothetical protein